MPRNSEKVAAAAAWFAIALTAGVAAQADPVALTSAAERALREGRREDSVLLLWQAREALAPLAGGPVRDAIETSIGELEPKADDRFAARTQACQQAARGLLGIARAYKGRGWLPTAAALCAQLAPLDAAAVAREMATLPKTGATAGQPVAPASAIERLGCHAQSGDWSFRGGVLCSPARAGAGDSDCYLTKVRHGNQRLAVSIDTGNEDSSGALLFGAAADDDYYICEIQTWKGSCDLGLTLWQWRGQQLQQLRQVEHRFPKQMDSHRLEVLVRDRAVDCRVEGVSLLRHELAEVAKGRIGFFVSGSKDNGVPVRFADFELTPLPENVEAERVQQRIAAQKQLVEAADRALAAAEALQRQKRPEAAATQLRAAVEPVRGIDDAAERARLLAAFDKQLAAVDPLHGRRRLAGGEAARLLAPIAEQYAAGGWLRVAARYAAMAAAFDPKYAGLAGELASRATDAR